MTETEIIVAWRVADAQRRATGELRQNMRNPGPVRERVTRKLAQKIGSQR